MAPDTNLEARERVLTLDLFGKLDLPAPGEATLQRLLRFLAVTRLWGAKMDLTAARSSEELVELSIADAAVMAHAEKSCSPRRTYMDVGSGGGAPGIPFLVLMTESAQLERIHLVEPRTKRSSFLRQAAHGVALENVEVNRVRSSELPGEMVEVALSRATLPPPEWVVEGKRLASSAFWMLLARENPPQLPGVEVELSLEYETPFSRAPRKAVRYRRV